MKIFSPRVLQLKSGLIANQRICSNTLLCIKKQEKANEHPVQWACVNEQHMVVWPFWPPYVDNELGSARRAVNNNENYLQSLPCLSHPNILISWVTLRTPQ